MLFEKKNKKACLETTFYYLDQNQSSKLFLRFQYPSNHFLNYSKLFDFKI